nr:hypothetical protein [Candidatus Freyarchaeota archaeon]
MKGTITSRWKKTSLENILEDFLNRLLTPQTITGRIRREGLRHVCECDGESVEDLDCNLVSMALCKTKIRDYQKKNSLIGSRTTKVFG